MKTARFADLVTHSGAPEAHPLWVAPAQDKTFQAAIKQHRVLTIHPETAGGKRDHGRVGFHEEPLAQYLVFPKSLRAYVDRRIVGINYNLLARPAEGRRGKAGAEARAPRRGGIKPRPNAGPRASSLTTPAAQPAAGPADAASVAVPPDQAGAETPASGASKETLAHRSPAAADAAVAKAKRAGVTRDRVAARQQGRRPANPWLPEVKRALKEMKAGKTVAAYERLDRLAHREDTKPDPRDQGVAVPSADAIRVG